MQFILCAATFDSARRRTMGVAACKPLKQSFCRQNRKSTVQPRREIHDHHMARNFTLMHSTTKAHTPDRRDPHSPAFPHSRSPARTSSACFKPTSTKKRVLKRHRSRQENSCRQRSLSRLVTINLHALHAWRRFFPKVLPQRCASASPKKPSPTNACSGTPARLPPSPPPRSLPAAPGNRPDLTARSTADPPTTSPSDCCCCSVCWLPGTWWSVPGR